VNRAKIKGKLIMVPSQMCNCAVPPDPSRSDILFSSTCNIPKRC